MFLHCGGRGVLRSSFPLAWLAEELLRWNTLKLLHLLQTEDFWPVAGGGVYGRGGLTYLEAQTWRCDKLSARRSTAHMRVLAENREKQKMETEMETGFI